MDITGIGSVAELASGVINKIWPDKTEQERMQLAQATAIITGQLGINVQEAKSQDRFVAGWRPFIGWVCGFACAWNWIGISICKVVAALAGVQITLASASLTEMFPVLIGMLGLGAYRTTEKLRSKN